MEAALAEFERLDTVEYSFALKTAAVISSLLEDRERTLGYLGDCLEKARGQCSVATLRLDPWWEYMREDADFRAMLERHGGR